jgi:putative ABC transport system permease protein
MRRAWELLRLALGGLRRTPLRVALTSAGVAIATGALVSMVGFGLGVQERVEEPFQKLELLNRLEVMPVKETPARPTDSGTADPAKARPAVVLDDAAVAQIARLPGVLLAYPDYRLSGAEVQSGIVSEKTTAIGLPAAAGRLRFIHDALVAGRFLQGDDSQEVILGHKLTERLGFDTPEEAIGRTITIQSKGLSPGPDGKFAFAERRIEVTVVGVWDPVGGRQGYTSLGVVLPLDVIRNLPGVGFDSLLERLTQGATPAHLGYGRVVVRVEHPGELFTVEERIKQMGFRTQATLTQLKEMRKAFIIMDLVLTAVATVALVVAGLGIINTQLMAVLERYREIGIYKALGASDGDVRLLFLAEAALVGLLGGTGGLVLGRVVSWLIEIVVNQIALSEGVDEPIMAFAFPLHLLGGAVAFAVVVSLISGVYPASRAARVDPIRALRAE